MALLLLPWPLVPAVQAKTAAGEVTTLCRYSLPDPVPVSRLTDGSLLTRLTVLPNKTVTVTLPACEKPSLYMTWFTLPPSVTLVQMDERGHQLKQKDLQPATFYERYELDPACRKVALSSKNAWTVSTLRVFDGDLPEDLVCFGALMKQADLLVVMGQPQALFEELGGLAPLYMNTFEVKTAFCYLCADSEVLQATAGDPRPLGEAVSALWSLGYREAPFVGGFQDHDFNELDDVQKSWTDKALEAYLVWVIRTVKPKVVVCAAGGAEDWRSAYVASRIGSIVELAANGGKYAEVGKAHHVQKLYVSDPQGSTVVDYGAVTETATAAYRQHVASRQLYRRALPSEGRFTLAYTKVGQDKQKKRC